MVFLLVSFLILFCVSSLANTGTAESSPPSSSFTAPEQLAYAEEVRNRTQAGLASGAPTWLSVQNISMLASAVSSVEDDTDVSPSSYIAAHFLLADFLASQAFDCSVPKLDYALARTALPAVADVSCDEERCPQSVMDVKADVILRILNATNLGGADCSLFSDECSCQLALFAAKALGQSTLLYNVPSTSQYVEEVVFPSGNYAILSFVFPGLSLRKAPVLHFALDHIRHLLVKPMNDLFEWNFLLDLLKKLPRFQGLDLTDARGLLDEIVAKKGSFPAALTVWKGPAALMNAAQDSLRLFASV